MLEWEDQKILDEIEKLKVSIKNSSLIVYVVSNEVGMGIVPEHKLGRRFRDLSGWAHQSLAKDAKEVYQMFMGTPLPIKRLSREYV